MGTYSDFQIGNFSLETSGNFNTTTRHSIYRASDRAFIDREDGLSKEGYRATLRAILPRLELLGHTLSAIERKFNNPYVTYDEPHGIKFTEALDLVRNTNLNGLDKDEGGDNCKGILPATYHERLESPFAANFYRSASWDLQALFEGLCPYDMLRMLAERTDNLDLVVQWDFMDVVESGYFELSDFSVGSFGQGYLLVTEGTSDTKVIQHAFEILRPEIADLFQYVDMKDNYPFGGHGNLMNFMRGLKSIGRAEGVLAVFDNDVVGVASLAKLEQLSGVNAIKLPDMEEFKSFPTIGPDGERLADINGKAAAIECYLKLPPKCRVRWSNFEKQAQEYQGAIEQTTSEKKALQDEFLSVTRADEYPFEKIEKVLDVIVEACIRSQR